MIAIPNTRPRLWYEWLGTSCRCGSTKPKRRAFCWRCYYTLPVRLRRPLYRRFSKRYVAAYRDACDYLDER